VESTVAPEIRRVRVLSGGELAELHRVARDLEERWGHAVDVEWAFDDSGNLYILQSRAATLGH